MFIPLTSDAELRHWPIMTGVMIVLTIVAFAIQHALPDTYAVTRVRDVVEPDEQGNFIVLDDDGRPMELDPDMEIGQDLVPGYYPWMLSHGDGIHPLQWLTNMFMHAGPGHLIGNLMFLWVFGLVVEGITGPIWFTLLYVGCGIVQSAIGQVLFLGTPEAPSLGASGAIYSLLVLAALWAPGDNIQSLVFIFFTFFFVEVPVLILAAIYLFLDFGTVLFSGFELSSAWLHVMGGAVGFAVGAAALQLDLVDCNRQDMLSRLREIGGKPVKPEKPRKPSSREVAEHHSRNQAREERVAVIEKSVDLHLNAGRPAQAIALMTEWRKHDPGAQWSEARLVKIIKSLKEGRKWDEMIHFMQEYIGRFAASDKANLLRFTMARIMLVEKNRPSKALSILKTVDLSRMNDAQKKAIDELRRVAQQRLADGELDFQD